MYLLTLCWTRLVLQLRYKQDFDISGFDISGFYCNCVYVKPLLNKLELLCNALNNGFSSVVNVLL